MLKDKNYQKALDLVNADPTPAKLTEVQLAEMIADAKVARDAYNAQAAAVKEHHNKVYGPMCEEKTRLEIKMHELDIRLGGLESKDPKVSIMVKLVMKALAKK